MVHTQCAICDSDAWDAELYRSRLTEEALTHETFSARRVPDRIHYRIVRCRNCGLVRSDPILPETEIARLYRGSAFRYEPEAVFAAATYRRYLREVITLLPAKDTLLEIGCGNGFFLEEAVKCGFANVYGVEPSLHAMARCRPELRNRIVNDVFRDGLFPDAYFRLICGFQVLDHISKPNEFLRTCRRLLSPDGLVLFISHDAGAWTNRLLGERSPMVDVEHTYLYDRATVARLFSKNAFQVRRVFSVLDAYPLRYWARLAPLPRRAKRALDNLLRLSRIGNLTIRFTAGNLGIIAQPLP